MTPHTARSTALPAIRLSRRTAIAGAAAAAAALTLAPTAVPAPSPTKRPDRATGLGKTLHVPARAGHRIKVAHLGGGRIKADVTSDAFGDVVSLPTTGTVSLTLPALDGRGEEVIDVDVETGSSWWVHAGDQGVYGAPAAVSADGWTTDGATTWVHQDALVEVLGLSFAEPAPSAAAFDGHAASAITTVVVTRGDDVIEIDPAGGRIGVNVTEDMRTTYADLSYRDLEVCGAADDLSLSTRTLRDLLDVRADVVDGVLHLSEQVRVARDTVTGMRKTSVAALGLSEDGLADLNAYLDAQVAEGFPSAAAVVTRHGKRVHEYATGWARKYSTTTLPDGTIEPAELLPAAQWQPTSTGTLYDLASNSKMYATNYAVMMLVSQGLLDLDRTIRSFPGWEAFSDASTVYTGKWTVGDGIDAEHTGKDTLTVRDVLHHEGGMLPDPMYHSAKVAGELYYQNTSDPSDRAGIIDTICRTPLAQAPRTGYIYSDVDFMILGLLVEQVTGQRLDDYLENGLYAAMGLEATVYNPLSKGFAATDCAATELNGNTRDGGVDLGTAPDGEPAYIRRYTVQGEVHDEKAYYTLAGVAGHAGLFSTLSDMSALTQVMVNEGVYAGQRWMERDVVAEFVAPYGDTPEAASTSTHGLGWRVSPPKGDTYWYFSWGPSRTAIGHTGWTGTLTVIDPQRDLTVTLLTNQRHSPVRTPGKNDFEAAEMELSDYVPVVGRVYQALRSA